MWRKMYEKFLTTEEKKLTLHTFLNRHKSQTMWTLTAVLIFSKLIQFLSTTSASSSSSSASATHVFVLKKTPIELVKIQCVKVFPSNCTNISLDYWKLARFVRLFFVRLPYYCVFCGEFVFLLWFIHNIYILFGILKDFNNSHQIGTPP